MYPKLQFFSGRLPKSARFLPGKVDSRLHPLIEALGQHLDKRLVRTSNDLFLIILAFRGRHMGFLPSELGAFIMGGPIKPLPVPNGSATCCAATTGHRI